MQSPLMVAFPFLCLFVVASLHRTCFPRAQIPLCFRCCSVFLFGAVWPGCGGSRLDSFSSCLGALEASLQLRMSSPARRGTSRLSLQKEVRLPQTHAHCTELSRGSSAVLLAGCCWPRFFFRWDRQSIALRTPTSPIRAGGCTALRALGTVAFRAAACAGIGRPIWRHTSRTKTRNAGTYCRIHETDVVPSCRFERSRRGSTVTDHDFLSSRGQD
jgi:hypothetical protein